MYNVKELEDKWLNYKIKKIIVPMLKVSALYVVVAGSYYLYSIQNHQTYSLLPSTKMTTVLGVSIDANNSIEEKKKMVVVEEKELKKVEEVIHNKNIEVVEKISLAPVIPVIDMEKEERISEVKKVRVKRHVKKASNLVAAKRNTYLTPKELAVVSRVEQKVSKKPHQTKKMSFQSTSVNYMDVIKAKFTKFNKPREALLLAKAYYKEKKYNESEQWALTANKLDNSLEESWFLFAQSKAKLGKQREALKVLVSYYKRSRSVKAKRLIDKIKRGEV